MEKSAPLPAKRSRGRPKGSGTKRKASAASGSEPPLKKSKAAGNTEAGSAKPAAKKSRVAEKHEVLPARTSSRLVACVSFDVGNGLSFL